MLHFPTFPYEVERNEYKRIKDENKNQKSEICWAFEDLQEKAAGTFAVHSVNVIFEIFEENSRI
jgi:hypothetical protein